MQSLMPVLTDRFRAAVALAEEVHGQQRRPGTEIPYVAHLLIVSGLVVEDGGDEDQAIAGLLHDCVEDGGGRLMLQRIASTFGPRVAEVVAACSDTVDGQPVGPWIERKRRYLTHLWTVDDEAVLRVSLADKLHNARSIVRGYRHTGQALWERFGDRSAADEVWYYSALVDLFERRRSGPLTDDFQRAVSELAWLVTREPASEGVNSFVTKLRRRAAPEPRRRLA
jgi:(p)ppGpp synthase/HD superfamily hydrolase